MSNYPNPLTTRFLDGVIRERPDKNALRKSYIGTTIMPFREVDEYEISWDVIRAANRIAGIYAMDGTPIPGDDPGFYQMMANVVNIAAARKLDEETVMCLREPGEVAEKSRVMRGKRNKALRMLRTMVANADDEVDTTVEYLVMSTLQGTLHWPPRDNDGNVIANAPAYWGNASFTLDFGFRDEFTQAMATLEGADSRAGGGYAWDNANADPLLDLEVIRDLMVDTIHMPVSGAKIIMSQSLLSMLATHDNVLNWIRGDNGPARDLSFVDFSTLRNFIQTKTEWDIMTYDAVWTYETNMGSDEGVTENHVRFLPKNTFIIIPPNALAGDIAYFATAPISGPNDEYRNGKQSWSEKLQKPPWTWEIGVQLKGFPILRSSAEIFVGTAY